MTFSRSFAAIAKLFAAERAFVYVTGRRQGVLDSVVAAIGANAIGIRNDIANFTYFDRKPVAMLVNGGTRSGKEILAYGFKKYRLGEIIGSRTEGAVLAATAFLIGGGLLSSLILQQRRQGVSASFDKTENRCTLSRIMRSSVGAQLCSAAPLKSIDHEMLAGHEHMRLDGQIAHDAGNVLRRADPSHGNACG
jgi:hypothetical protein